MNLAGAAAPANLHLHPEPGGRHRLGLSNYFLISNIRQIKLNSNANTWHLNFRCASGSFISDARDATTM